MKNRLFAAALVSMLIFSSLGGLVFTSDSSFDADGFDHIDEVPAGWTGIYTADDLSEIKSDGAYPLSGKFIQMTDITLSGEHVHIGFPGTGNYFTGEYDGNGYHIKGMSITATYDSGSSSRAGLFGAVSGARIVNVTILDMSIELRRGVTAGGIVGYAIDSEIVGCSVSGSISVISGSSSSTVGGVVGYLYRSAVSRCANFSDIYANSNSSYSIHAGGIVGDMRYSTAVSDCYNTGSVRVTGSTSTGTGAAGIVCWAYSESASTYPKVISNCYNTGVVTFSGRPAESSAIFAMNSASIVSSYALHGTASRIYGDGAQTDSYTSFKTAGELKDRSTFAGWNFGLRWMIEEGSYPVLVTRSSVFNPVSDVTLTVDTHYRFVLTDIADITVAYTGPDWLSLSADNILSGMPSVVGVYTVTVSADNLDLGIETSTWTITVVPEPLPPSVTLIKRQLTSDTFTFSVSASGYTNLFWSLSDGTAVPPGTLVLRHTFKSGVSEVTVTASSDHGSDTSISEVVLYDGSPAKIGYTTMEYRFAPDIGDGDPVLTVTNANGNVVSVFTWDPVKRCVVGTPSSAYADKKFHLVLEYGVDGSIEWDVHVLAASSIVPTASFTYTVSDKTVFLTSRSNVETGSSLYKWEIYDLNGSRIFLSEERNPIFDSPAYSMYFVTLEITNMKGSAKSSQSIIVTAGGSDPDPGDGDDGSIIGEIPQGLIIAVVFGIVCIAIGAVLALQPGTKKSGKKGKKKK